MRLVVGLVVVLGVFVFSAAPAFAEFESLLGSGKARTGERVFEGGGGTLVCKEVLGKWKQPIFFSQKMSVLFEKWVGCKLKSKELKEVEAKVGECEYEFKSIGKGITSNANVTIAAVAKQCVIIASSCEITMPTEIKAELKKGLAKNEGSNLALVGEYEGINDKVGGTCPGITSTKEGKDKFTDINESEKLSGTISYLSEEAYGCGNPASPGMSFPCVGMLINPATGNLVESHTDLVVWGRGPGLVLSLTYNSTRALNAESGVFGYGWAYSYGAHLLVNEGAETATVTQGNGSTVVFYGRPSTKFIAGGWVQATLVKEGENYVYTLPDRTKLTFNGSGQLTAEADRNGNSVKVAYNVSNQIETVTDGDERKLTFAYKEGFVESVKDPMGHTVKYTYEGGKLASVTLPGEEKARWKFVYNTSREMTEITGGMSNTTKTEWESNRVSAQTDPVGNKRTLKYTTPGTETKLVEPNGSETVELFNTPGLATSIKLDAGEESLAATTTFEYDTSYNLKLVTDPNKHTIKYGYNATDDRTSEVDPNGNETKWTFDGKHDVESITLPKTEKTTMKLNANGEPETIESPGPGETTQKTVYKYGLLGEVSEATDPLSHITKYTYNAAGDLESATDQLGNKITWESNLDSQVTASVSPRGNVKGGEPAKYTTKLTLDEQGRPKLVTDPLGHTFKTTFNGDGGVESVTDGNEHTTTYTSNGDDETTKVEEPNKTIIETGYNSEGQVKKQVDGNKHATSYEYNKLEELTEEVDALERKTKMEYDPAGNMKKLLDPMGRSVTYGYDSGNRITELSYSTGKPATVKYEYTSDGYVKKMVDGTGETLNTYDTLDRLSESKDGNGDITGYEYNLVNEPTKITYPNKEKITRNYDEGGRLESITDWLKNTTKFSYDANSNETGIAFPSGTEKNEDKYTFNEADQMTEAKFVKGATTLGSLVYTRDNDGQLKKTVATELPGEKETEYEYDANNRLTKAGSTPYEYDPAYNIKTIGTNILNYKAADELEKTSNATFAFNEDGQRLKETPTEGSATTYGYDQAENLTSVERPEGKEGKPAKIENTYAYDGNGLRASQTIKGTTTHMTWDAAEESSPLLNDGTNSYIYGPEGQPIEQINGEGKPLYLHHDQLGSTRLLTSSTGTNEGAFTYDAYGNTAATKGSATTPLGYGEGYKNNDELIYLKARELDPKTAQLLTKDPGKAETEELYSYAEDNPVNNTDPTGERPGRGGCRRRCVQPPYYIPPSSSSSSGVPRSTYFSGPPPASSPLPGGRVRDSRGIEWAPDNRNNGWWYATDSDGTPLAQFHWEGLIWRRNNDWWYTTENGVPLARRDGGDFSTLWRQFPNNGHWWTQRDGGWYTPVDGRWARFIDEGQGTRGDRYIEVELTWEALPIGRWNLGRFNLRIRIPAWY
ncbi:MAG TPA: DUF6531 domain-containing protein [Solirubrobacteraceae bacterium]|nr:DUF6531 domain-containing protein [Solirubrobacteraceae bacterium]